MNIDRRTLIAGIALAATPWVARGAPPFASRRIAVSVRGRGPDVVLIPGLASGPGVWNAMVAALPDYRLHLVHIAGFARLPGDLNRTGPVLAPVRDEIARCIATLGSRRPAVIGHSMGGTLAMMIGLRGLASRVMVIDMLPAGAGMLGGTANGLGFLADQLGQYFTGTRAGRRYLADIVSRAPGAQGSEPDVIANALRDLAQVDLAPSLARLNVPLEVLYAVGGDRAQAAEISRRFRAAYAGKRDAHLRAIGPSGHIIMADQPARCAAAMRSFLSGRA
ncbi:pimeloyl-ACP methyl ester carboxylesterase [Sphingobium fontiphilum]|uniref:Pimeloyl-ACP methyl ester carboxylesterase n=1 Tax=Sphingobium fontiphilum TaxID=944425 RepID=A0A7W6GN97_9SPHN|nr:alpha/beta hydrolase [Sphingobium fontiphilum]MBB3981078.1 pimeloyl-ACP methyl ester carboxylesterase [Sphingobium fontiphilum]